MLCADILTSYSRLNGLLADLTDHKVQLSVDKQA